MDLLIGAIYRYSSTSDINSPIVDGLPNYFYYTNDPNSKTQARFQSGIHGIQIVKTNDGKERRPAIIVSSSPHKVGTEQTPWEDHFDPDNGYIRYFGDNKSAETNPEGATGNKILLDAYRVHSSQDRNVRKDAVPIIFFKRVAHNGRIKGNLRFQGFGIVESVELVTQHDSNGNYFSNYVFNMCVLSMQNENEKFSWNWINSRRDIKCSGDSTHIVAPLSWRDWVKYGSVGLSKVRRKVSKLSVIKATEQIPVKATKEFKTLQDIYQFFSTKRHHFELLAMRVVEYILNESGVRYVPGWITQKSSDGGTDFVGRIDISSGLSGMKLVVLGQAKCEALDSPTNGRDIARTVARLKRGWFGAYVTTSYFSSAVQQEVIEDQYPIMMVNGLKLADTVNKMIFNRGISLADYLEELENEYSSNVSGNRPEDIMKL